MWLTGCTGVRSSSCLLASCSVNSKDYLLILAPPAQPRPHRVSKPCASQAKETSKASSDSLYQYARHGQDDKKGLAHFPDPCLGWLFCLHFACICLHLSALACMGLAVQPIKRLGGGQTRQEHCQAFLGSFLVCLGPHFASIASIASMIHLGPHKMCHH